MNALPLLLVCFLQDPEPAPQTQRLDVVELKNGDQLTGRVTAELDGYVEVEIETGAVIGVSRSMVAKVRRAAVATAVVPAAVRPEDGWFVLHDADGASVGWLHTAVTTAADGTFTVSEEYEFVCGPRRYQVTNLCTADAAGIGRTCYFRERISEPVLATQRPPTDDPLSANDRVVGERIVEARVDGQNLVVLRVDGQKRAERTLPWGEGATFPLLARTFARQAAVAIGPVTMFDPSVEQLVDRSIDGTGARQVVVDGQPKRLAEVVETTASGRNREWIAAGLHTVRRELSGPALVAVPSSAASARGAVGVTSIPAAVVAEADGRFGIWIPHPAWVAVEPLPAGHLALRCEANGAEIRLSLVDHLDPGTKLETAADAVASWFELMHPELPVDGRMPHRVRDQQAIRLTASGRAGRSAPRATIDVVPHGEHFLVLICRAPAPAWNELSRDFEFVVRTVELDGRALTPTLQGPLAEQPGRNKRPPTGAMPAPAPAARVTAPNDTSVRIPN